MGGLSIQLVYSNHTGSIQEGIQGIQGVYMSIQPVYRSIQGLSIQEYTGYTAQYTGYTGIQHVYHVYHVYQMPAHRTMYTAGIQRITGALVLPASVLRLFCVKDAKRKRKRRLQKSQHFFGYFFFELNFKKKKNRFQKI